MLSGTLPGIIVASLFFSGMVGYLLSLLILRLYRKATIKGMMASAVDPSCEPAPELISYHAHAQLEFAEPVKSVSHLVSAKYQQLVSFLNKRLIIYGSSALVFAFVWSYLYLDFGDLSKGFNRVLYCVVLFFWPFVFIQNRVWATHRKQKLVTIVAYAALFIITVLLVSVQQGRGFNPLSLLLAWLIYNVTPAIVLLLIINGKVRSISPIVAGFVFMAFLTASIAVAFFSSNDITLKTFVDQVHDLGLRQASLFFLLFIILAGLGAGVLLLMLLKKIYSAKLVNDQQLSIDAVLLIFSAFYSIALLSPNASLISALFILVPFASFKIATLVLFKLLKTRSQNKVPSKLLLLRVFALNKAGKISFEKLQRHWQYAGPIAMISGPDLATSTIDAPVMIDFVTNRLSNHFCNSPAMIEKNVAKMDVKPDIDGSFRITEFFCRDNNWKDVLLRLVSVSDIVLIDLRSFSEKYKGCQYEIQQLINYISLSRVVVLMNEQTNVPFLKKTFNEAFQNRRQLSPNTKEPAVVQLYFFNPVVPSNFSGLLKLLCSLSPNRPSSIA